MDTSIFQHSKNWSGTYYELALELGPTGDDDRLLSALRFLWQQPQLRGPWACREDFGKPAAPLSITSRMWPSHYGIMQLEGGKELGCMTGVIREEDGSDWLDLCIPTNMLELVFDVAYPLEVEFNAWKAGVDKVFTDIAAAVFADCPFLVGLVGEEVSGNTDSMMVDDPYPGTMLLPRATWASLEQPRPAVEIADGLMMVGGGE